MAKRGPMPEFATVDDYLVGQPPATREKLSELRAIIKATVPEAEEILNYKVPAYRLVPGGRRDYQIMMAGYAKHVGFYPFPTTMAAFADELAAYKQGKGSVQFPLNAPLPAELISRMIRFRKAELTALQTGKKS